MSSLTAGKHAGSGAASNQPAVAEPTFAERARTMMYLGRMGVSRHFHASNTGSPLVPSCPMNWTTTRILSSSSA